MDLYFGPRRRKIDIVKDAVPAMEEVKKIEEVVSQEPATFNDEPEDIMPEESIVEIVETDETVEIEKHEQVKPHKKRKK